MTTYTYGQHSSTGKTSAGDTIIPIKTGQKGTIVSIDSSEIRVALMQLGVVPGDDIILSDIAPLGDPVAIAVNGTKVSLRKKDAYAVWIKA